MFLLKRLTGALSKYLWIGLLATTASTATFAYLYREALQDTARVQAEAERDAAIAANNRASQALLAAQSASEARERALLDRINTLNRTTAEAEQRAALSERVLRDYETERLSDESPEYQEWAETELPSGVVARLRSLGDGR